MSDASRPLLPRDPRTGVVSTVDLQIHTVKLMTYLADLGLPCRVCGLYLADHPDVSYMPGQVEREFCSTKP